MATRLRTEFVCGDCGYGIAVAVPPPRCPMCRSSAWRPRTDAGARPEGERARRRLNDLLRVRLGASAAVPIAFYCECGDSGCRENVWLTCVEYDRLRALGRAVVAGVDAA